MGLFGEKLYSEEALSSMYPHMKKIADRLMIPSIKVAKGNTELEIAQYTFKGRNHKEMVV